MLLVGCLYLLPGTLLLGWMMSDEYIRSEMDPIAALMLVMAWPFILWDLLRHR